MPVRPAPKLAGLAGVQVEDVAGVGRSASVDVTDSVGVDLVSISEFEDVPEEVMRTLP